MSGSDTVVGYFTGFADEEIVAHEGAVLGFADLERELRRVAGEDAASRLDPSRGVAHEGRRPRFSGTALSLRMLHRAIDPVRLAPLDVVYANCGPLAALLFEARERHGLDFRIIREVRTLGWVGYAFQESVARALGRPTDRCVHASEYARGIWATARGPGDEHAFYPVVERRSGDVAARRIRLPNQGRVAGYFSRVTRDKGFHELPRIVERLHHAGWPLREVRVYGSVIEPEWIGAVRESLRAQQVELRLYGEVPHRRALAAIEAVDVVLFPSLSSFESAGRVVVEAVSIGRAAVASDFCAGAELGIPGLRIPVRFARSRRGSTSRAFSVGTLDVDAWNPPSPAAVEGIEIDDEAYRSDPERLRALLDPAPLAARSLTAAPLAMSIEAPDFDRETALESCAGVRRALAGRAVADRGFLQLGGRTKHAILDTGYRPDVEFRRCAKREAQNLDRVPGSAAPFP